MVGFSVDNMEDTSWSHLVGTLEILGGVWHILTKPWLGLVVRLYGQAVLSFTVLQLFQ
jgi:hypothetical protein